MRCFRGFVYFQVSLGWPTLYSWSVIVNTMRRMLQKNFKVLYKSPNIQENLSAFIHLYGFKMAQLKVKQRWCSVCVFVERCLCIATNTMNHHRQKHKSLHSNSYEAFSGCKTIVLRDSCTTYHLCPDILHWANIHGTSPDVQMTDSWWWPQKTTRLSWPHLAQSIAAASRPQHTALLTPTVKVGVNLQFLIQCDAAVLLEK